MRLLEDQPSNHHQFSRGGASNNHIFSRGWPSNNHMFSRRRSGGAGLESGWRGLGTGVFEENSTSAFQRRYSEVSNVHICHFMTV